ncbi:Uncharacterised protein [Neisseria gonorrhoeae]|uniref:Uncharacterized protein n=1 Tax=Neisseria gonorrhoeae TaxID=485 RepID=A0A378VWN2_NEIGO|nr:Uncharacterised protein [Neisseria gonorrhoeae]
MSGIAVGLIAGYIVALFWARWIFPHCKPAAGYAARTV